MITACIDEIFSSVQGEGPRIGERHIFVRFQGCDIRCRYCDTPAATQAAGVACRAQNSTITFDYEQVPNPVSTDVLVSLCRRLAIPGVARPLLSLTGGEPLLQQRFLAAWLPRMRPAFRIYLETNGIQFMALRELADLVDVVSMDIKLPSATGLRPFWDEHQRFLAAAQGKECFAKAVVTNDTLQIDIVKAATVVADVDPTVPLIIQPASGVYAPEPARLLAFQEAAMKVLAEVRVIPQVHKMLQVP